MARYHIAVLLLVELVACISAEKCRYKASPCMDYTVLRTEKDYEVRLYNTTRWISAEGFAVDRSHVSRQLIMALYSYLSGNNEKGLHLEKIVPFRTKKVPGKSTNAYTIAIPISSELQEDPPRPTDPNLAILLEPPTEYVVRTFPGYIRDENVWERERDKLTEDVAAEKEVETSYYFWAVYDHPWERVDRRNEVWMVEKQNA